MGASVSKISALDKIREPSLVDVFIEVPLLLDVINCKDLRALTQVNKDMRQIASHPKVWANIFAKEVGAHPTHLPPPPRHLFSSVHSDRQQVPPAFKVMCQGLAAVQHIAEHPEIQVKNDPYYRVLISTVDQYLEDHIDTFYSNLMARQSNVKKYRVARKRLGKEIAIDSAFTAVGTSGLGANLYGISQVKSLVAAGKTAKVVHLTATLGAKGAKIYLYTLFGASGLFGIVVTGCFGYLTVGNVRDFNRQCIRHQESMRLLRTQAKIEAGRQLYEGHRGERNG
jgi:hypothetical protein